MAKKVKIVKNKSKSLFEIKIGILLVGAVLFFWVPLEDAMNLSKFTIVLLLILPFSLRNFNLSIVKFHEGKVITILIGLFFVFALISSILGNETIISLLGNHARLNGLLLYSILGLFFITIVANFEFKNFNKFLVVNLIGSLVLLTYSLLQFFERDFVNWGLAFNRIVGTLGNPDFNAVYLGFSGITATYFAIRFTGFARFASSFLGIIFFFVSYSTQAKQGVFVLFVGLVILLFYRKIRNKIVIILGQSIMAILTLLTTLAMLNQGPLAKYIYTVSISFRGDYWRAGWRMFTENPIFGVGFGRYGDYFREYRDIKQVVRRGSELTSDQPHNVFLDYLSTGGVITFAIYVSLVMFIFFLAAQNVRKSTDEISRLQASLLLALFSAYTLQSLISIDQVALATFGWTIGSLIVVQTRHRKMIPVHNNKEVSFINLITPITLFVLSLVLIIPIWRADVAARYVNGLSSKLNIEANAEFVSLQTDKLAGTETIDPYYYQLAGISYLRFNKVDQAITMFEKALKLNSRDAVSMATLASIYMQIEKCSKSLTYSRYAVEMDPYNQTNLLDRMRCLVKTKQLEEAKIMQERILAINPTNEVAKFSKTLI